MSSSSPLSMCTDLECIMQGYSHYTFIEQLTHPKTRKVSAGGASGMLRLLGAVALLGLDLLSALVNRLQDRFRAQIGTVLPSLIDRLGDSKDQVREQDQTLLLKIMEQAASPQYVWDRMLGGFKHKNNRTREGVCLCLIATLNTYGAQGLTLSKIVPHICNLLGDPTSQVRDGAMSCLVEIYRHVGERVRLDLSKKGLPQSRLNVIFSKFDEVQRSGNMISSSGSGQWVF
ncbi:hypothetical protein WMY93_002528 [Mugilogobius chulae]|uniref:TOG domain-containing protein n=1 Tax=Mugilogobius chulae TaxID=88201 RepID=A0AAW0Q3W9_9GOBI